MHRFRPENTFSHSLARAKSDEGGHLATLADIDSTTLEQGNGSILVSRPGSILASAEVDPTLLADFPVLISVPVQSRRLGYD
jgi:hypothetical protein